MRRGWLVVMNEQPFENYVRLQETWCLDKHLSRAKRWHVVTPDETEMPVNMSNFDVPETWRWRSLYETARRLLVRTNEQYWGFVLDAWQQPLRFNRYSTGGYITMHGDHNYRDGSKLTIIQLVRKAEEGGDLYVDSMHVPLEEGDIIVKPSFMMHEVTPVLKGERITLSGWATGPRFR